MKKRKKIKLLLLWKDKTALPSSHIVVFEKDDTDVQNPWLKIVFSLFLISILNVHLYFIPFHYFTLSKVHEKIFARYLGPITERQGDINNQPLKKYT